MADDAEEPVTATGQIDLMGDHLDVGPAPDTRLDTGPDGDVGVVVGRRRGHEWRHIDDRNLMSLSHWTRQASAARQARKELGSLSNARLQPAAQNQWSAPSWTEWYLASDTRTVMPHTGSWASTRG